MKNPAGGGAFDCVFTLLKGYRYDFGEVMEEFYHNRGRICIKNADF